MLNFMGLKKNEKAVEAAPKQQPEEVKEKAPEQEEATESKADEKQGTKLGMQDYEELKSNLMQIGNQNPDLVRFAQYLGFKEYVTLSDEPEPGRIYYSCGPNFCSMKHVTPWYRGLQTSRLKQCYLCDLFTDKSFEGRFLVKNAGDTIPGVCDEHHPNGCPRADKPQAFCPYGFAAAVKYVARQTNRLESEMYRELLGQSYREFRLPEKVEPSKEFRDQLIGIDANSSRAAYLMMQADLVHLEYSDPSRKAIICRYVPLCDEGNREALINRIITFWKTRKDTEQEIALNPAGSADLRSWIVSGHQTCARCSFKQCPMVLAAYFTVLSGRYCWERIDPMNLAYLAATKNVNVYLTPNEHYKYSEHADAIDEMQFIPKSREEIKKVLRYIVNRSKNSAAPQIPLNLVLHTEDETFADEFFDRYVNMLWYFDYFKTNRKLDSKTLSVASLSLEGVIQEYEAAEGAAVFHIKEIEMLESAQNARTLMPKLCRLVKEKTKIITVVSGEQRKLERIFDNYTELYHQVLSYHLYSTDMSGRAVYLRLISKLEENFEVEREAGRSLWSYIMEEYESNELRSHSYIDWLYNKIVFNHFNSEIGASERLLPTDIPQAKPRRSEEEIFAELNTMTGLAEVKTRLAEINDLIKYFMKIGRKNEARPNMHMVFAGNAGTGKTTVARLMAEILYSIGYIQQNKLLVCSGKDLIAEYLGQTQQKTVQKCEQAYGGVLFIDEAYQLNPYAENQPVDIYKKDVVNELIQQMENNRDRLLVIFAGYTKEMQEFVKKANPGLESRIAYTIEFPDYSDRELFEIFSNIAKREKLSLSKAAEDRVKQYIRSERENGGNFGNARFARNLFERSQMLHARNTRDCTTSDERLYLLTEEDITV